MSSYDVFIVCHVDHPVLFHCMFQQFVDCICFLVDRQTLCGFPTWDINYFFFLLDYSPRCCRPAGVVWWISSGLARDTCPTVRNIFWSFKIFPVDKVRLISIEAGFAFRDVVPNVTDRFWIVDGTGDTSPTLAVPTSSKLIIYCQGETDFYTFNVVITVSSFSAKTNGN